MGSVMVLKEVFSVDIGLDEGAVDTLVTAGLALLTAFGVWSVENK